MKLLKKSFYVLAFLGLILGVVPKAEAINWFNIGVSAAIAIGLYKALSRQTTPGNSVQPAAQETITPSNQTRQEITPIANRQASINPELYASKIIYEKLIDGINLQVAFCETYESDYIKEYKVYIKQLNAYRNFAKFTVFKKYTVGFLDVLHVEQKNRKKNYGALLFACAIKEMIDLGCKKITWSAEPNDLLPSQTIEETLPKLIKFYQQLGAQPFKIETQKASMQITDLKKAREGIYKIIEKWESKSSVEVNNNKALQRATAIVKHIAPK